MAKQISETKRSIDLSEWNLEEWLDLSSLEKLVTNLAEQCIAYAFDGKGENGWSIYKGFDYLYSDTKPNDPLDLYLMFPVFGEHEPTTTINCNLRDFLEGPIDFMDEDESEDKYTEIASALRVLADEIDAKVAESSPE
jgi:hypothetical protein